MKKFITLLAALAMLLAFAGCTPSEYEVNHNLQFIEFDGGDIAIVEEDYEATLEAQELYKLPQTVVVTVGGETLKDSDYTYDSTTGQLTVPSHMITGEIEISATAELITYAVVTDALAGIRFDGDAVAYPQQSYKATLVAEEYYLLPETVSVSVGGQILGEGDYIYDSATGELTVNADVTGEIAITAEAQPIVYALDTTAVSGLTVSYENGEAPTEVAPAFGYSATLVSSEGYALPESVEVLVDGVALDASAYTYDAVAGKLEIPGPSITGAVEIRGSGVALIVGQWQGGIDMSEYMNDMIAGSDPGMASYFHFEDLTLNITFTFRADGTASLEAQEDSAQNLFNAMKAEMIEGLKVMLQELLYAQGLNIDVDDYLTLVGMDLEDLFDQSVDMDSMSFDDLESSGMYLVEGAKIYLYDAGETYDETDYITYTLDGDTLTLEIGTNAGEGYADYVFPLILTRVPE